MEKRCDILLVGRGQNTTGRESDNPWVTDQNSMDRGFDIPWVGCQNTIGREFNIPWVRGQHAMDRGPTYQRYMV